MVVQTPGAACWKCDVQMVDLRVMCTSNTGLFPMFPMFPSQADITQTGKMKRVKWSREKEKDKTTKKWEIKDSRWSVHRHHKGLDDLRETAT